jgi:hypothetical protein
MRECFDEHAMITCVIGVDLDRDGDGEAWYQWRIKNYLNTGLSFTFKHRISTECKSNFDI